ncbi:hypothetical protein KOI35_00930 [Actinoplanes bogorensis]|uniref:Uncharacterized protein n=1 Tax=Paractinoplanes bogorensis TaxID=1610840 RepID=A0ABS5YGF6_9ACTN|nr:hypothetical protein [Actinoplanes bogorensis]MBU2662061.1 hypothetical protein [Actinoplanes bogorensis]
MVKLGGTVPAGGWLWSGLVLLSQRVGGLLWSGLVLLSQRVGGLLWSGLVLLSRRVGGLLWSRRGAVRLGGWPASGAQVRPGKP